MAFLYGHLCLETRRRREEQKEVIDFAGLIASPFDVVYTLDWKSTESTVYSASDDGWNPDEILRQLIWRVFHYLQGFAHPRWCRISSINSCDDLETPQEYPSKRPKQTLLTPKGKYIVSQAPFFRGRAVSFRECILSWSFDLFWFGMLLARAKECPFMVISPPVNISKRTPATSHVFNKSPTQELCLGTSHQSVMTRNILTRHPAAFGAKEWLGAVEDCLLKLEGQLKNHKGTRKADNWEMLLLDKIPAPFGEFIQLTRWWFQIFVMFHPTWEIIQFD